MNQNLEVKPYWHALRELSRKSQMTIINSIYLFFKLSHCVQYTYTHMVYVILFNTYIAHEGLMRYIIGCIHTLSRTL